jgi:hypothetical protein
MFDIFMTQYFLARAEHALGNVAAAQNFVAAARTTGEGIWEHPAVQALLQRFGTNLNSDASLLRPKPTH